MPYPSEPATRVRQIARCTRFFTAVNIRKLVLKAARLADLVELGTLSPQAAAFLEASVPTGPNILVAGGTPGGKTAIHMVNPNCEGVSHGRKRARSRGSSASVDPLNGARLVPQEGIEPSPAA
jgi:hypothetical protein